LADNWVLMYNGETAIQDVAAGSRDQIAIRDPHAYSKRMNASRNRPGWLASLGNAFSRPRYPKRYLDRANANGCPVEK